MSELGLVRNRLRTNPRQYEAFTTSGHCIVVAPPGSGKTELLTAKLAQDFIDVIPEPHGAACITYSNGAAGELSTRLARLGVRRRSNLFVGTVHSFAWTQVVRPFAPLVGWSDVAAAHVATEEQRDAAFAAAREAVFGDSNPPGLRATMDRRRRHLVIDETDQALFGGARDAELAKRYEDELRSQGLVDFDAMVRSAVELVQAHEFVRRVLTARFSKVYVDEYQDLGPGLHALIKALCFDEAANATVFAVADPEQCIYVFSGADPGLVQELADRYDVTYVELQHNYRSADAIIEASVRLLDSPIDVEGDREGGLVRVCRVDGGIQGQANAVVPLITEALRTSKPEDVAVLCLTNPDCEAAADVLIDNEIPVFVRRAGEYPRTPATSFIETAADWATTSRGSAGVALRELLWNWRALLTRDCSRLREIELARVLLDYEPGDGGPADRFVSRIVDLGLLAALERDERRAEDADGVRQMLRSIGAGTLHGLTVTELGARAFAKNRVHVLTIHASKGLEFDVVYALGLEYTRFPRYKSAPWEVLQQRRQFYVTLTRARDAVYLFYTGWQITRRGRWDHGPSPFISRLRL